jgi:circadian clock protein KaiC
MTAKRVSGPRPNSIKKAPTGISGLDEITFGGLPAGRPTLVCGGAGAGKTIMAAEFLFRGATEFDEPGVFMMFEESATELTDNVRSLGFDLDQLVGDGKIVIDHVHIERSEIEETGEYDLEGLFIRLSHAIQSIGAKRVVLDTIEALFAGLPNHAILRAELRRLFRWLKDQGMTAVITAERGENSLTRYGLEEYVADCVMVLDNRISEQISTRRLRVVKYRGSAHGTNEFPFLIGKRGISVMPITSLRLDHKAPTDRVSSGIPQLDEMLGGKGFYRGSSILISGSPGTGKSSLVASFAAAACQRGERALLFAYEESSDQFLRNMNSIGIKLAPYIKSGLLKILATRPTLQGLEQHLVSMHDAVTEFQPQVVMVDPISNLTLERHDVEVKPTLMRLIDLMKQQQITAMFTTLTSDAGDDAADSQVGVSSLMDTWLLLRNVEYNGERNRTIFVLKSRGMSHSNQVREFHMTGKGIQLVDVYLGTDRVLTGTARATQEQKEKAARELRRQDHNRRLRQLKNRQKAIDAQIAALHAQAEAEADEVNFLIAADQLESEDAEVAARTVSRLRRRDGGTRSEKVNKHVKS